jgi:hypothetical protein
MRAEWPESPLTARQWGMLLVLWLMWLVVVPLDVAGHVLVGVARGVTQGAFDGAQSSHRLLTDWWEMVRRS